MIQKKVLHNCKTLYQRVKSMILQSRLGEAEWSAQTENIILELLYFS
jgi:hypothetical protein